MQFTWSKILIGLAVVGIAVGASAADFKKGNEAYQHGRYEVALRELQPLAAQGNAQAQYMLGVMYYDGLGVGKDKNEAEKWIRLAAEQRDAKAQFLMALHFSGGPGVSQDNVKAQMWIHLAQAHGLYVTPEIIDRFAQRLTATERSQAFKLAQECAEKNFKGC